MHHDSELVTGDAVVLDLQLARSGSRALAYGIDVLVQVFGLFLILLALGLLPISVSLAFVITIITTVQLIVLIAYPTMLETFTRGRTLGKLVFGLRVVRQDGGPIRFRHAFIRALTGVFVDFGPFGAWSFVGFLVSLGSRDSKRIGDFLAGTVVIRQRAPRSSAVPISMPPALASWAAQLDLTALPDDLALSARQYLSRYYQLNSSSRERVGQQLASEVAGRIGAAIPPHVPAWAYLSAVLAERQSRAYTRMSRTDQPPGVQFQQPGTQPPSAADPSEPPDDEGNPFTPPV